MNVEYDFAELAESFSQEIRDAVENLADSGFDLSDPSLTIIDIAEPIAKSVFGPKFEQKLTKRQLSSLYRNITKVAYSFFW